MKKLFRDLLITILVIAAAAFSFIFWRGYETYKDITSRVSMQEKVNQVMSSPHFVTFEELPQMLADATIAIEDHRYYSHGAVDYIGLARAIASQVVPGMMVSGGSTITQQTAKNLYGLFESSIDRKAAEFFMARELEKICTKEQILAIYVNIINYGDNHTGIYEAAWGYFGVSPQSLDAAQCTILAGIPQSPNNFELTGHFQQAKKRQKQVLDAMVENGYITSLQAEDIYSTSIWLV